MDSLGWDPGCRKKKKTHENEEELLKASVQYLKLDELGGKD